MKHVQVPAWPFIVSCLAIVGTLWFRTFQVQAQDMRWYDNRLYNLENNPQILWREPNVRDPNVPDVGVML